MHLDDNLGRESTLVGKAAYTHNGQVGMERLRATKGKLTDSPTSPTSPLNSTNTPRYQLTQRLLVVQTLKPPTNPHDSLPYSPNGTAEDPRRKATRVKPTLSTMAALPGRRETDRTCPRAVGLMPVPFLQIGPVDGTGGLHSSANTSPECHRVAASLPGGLAFMQILPVKNLSSPA